MKKVAVSLKLVVLGMALAGASTQSTASGFQLFEGNAVNIGDFGAGGAAIAEDASTATYNPAGLVRIKTPQLVLSAVGIRTKADFSGSNAWQVPIPIIPSYAQTGSASGGGFKVVPAFHYAVPLNERVVFGFSVTAPFGLATDYDTTSVVRYEATKSEVKTLDLSPSLGVKINEQLSIGAGINLQKLDATLNSATRIPYANLKKARIDFADGQSTNKAASWAFGWHAGALYQFTPATRVGINYASQIKHHLTGTSSLTVPDLNLTLTGADTLTSDITLPPVTTLSAYHDVNDRWALLGSVAYTQWDKVDNIALNNVRGFLSNKITVTLPENFRNTWRVAVGTNYKLNEQWLLRAGVGFDQTPVNNTDRGVRLPDGDRMGLAVGAHYQPTKALGIDMGYTHLFIKDGDINHTLHADISQVNTVGTVKSAADLLGLQVTWSIV